MMYEINKKNSLSLYHFYERKGLNMSFKEFNNQLFQVDNIMSFSKTFVVEQEGRVVAFIQYGRGNYIEGVIRLFYCEKGYEHFAKELLFRATSYFYMFHLDEVHMFDETLRIGNVSEGTVLYSNMEELMFGFKFKTSFSDSSYKMNQVCF